MDTSRSTLTAVLPLAIVHTLGNLLTNVSLGMVAVSFTHTIKALEPLFSVLFSVLFLGDVPNPIVLLTLLPIMGGVIGASLTEASFNWPGFVSAMGSNVTFQSRNVFSKKFMTPEIKQKVRLPRSSTRALRLPTGSCMQSVCTVASKSAIQTTVAAYALTLCPLASHCFTDNDSPDTRP